MHWGLGISITLQHDSLNTSQGKLFSAKWVLASRFPTLTSIFKTLAAAEVSILCTNIKLSCGMVQLNPTEPHLCYHPAVALCMIGTSGLYLASRMAKHLESGPWAVGERVNVPVY